MHRLEQEESCVDSRAAACPSVDIEEAQIEVGGGAEATKLFSGEPVEFVQTSQG